MKNFMESSIPHSPRGEYMDPYSGCDLNFQNHKIHSTKHIDQTRVRDKGGLQDENSLFVWCTNSGRETLSWKPACLSWGFRKQVPGTRYKLCASASVAYLAKLLGQKKREQRTRACPKLQVTQNFLWCACDLDSLLLVCGPLTSSQCSVETIRAQVCTSGQMEQDGWRKYARTWRTYIHSFKHWWCICITSIAKHTHCLRAHKVD